jgi:hypothetical protein
MSRPLTWLGPADTVGEGPLVSLADVSEIELLILKRMREFTIGEHSSLFHGSGFDFTGVRDWQAGDRFEAIDWPQSSLRNFSPLIVREFDQPSTSSVVIVADKSASTRCGIDCRGDHRTGDCHHRHVGGVLSRRGGAHHVRRRVHQHRGVAAAHRQEPGDQLSGRLSA